MLKTLGTLFKKCATSHKTYMLQYDTSLSLLSAGKLSAHTCSVLKVYSTESYFSVLPWYYFFVELLVACKTLELAETNVGHGSPATDN